jgi:hypothetical protein
MAAAVTKTVLALFARPMPAVAMTSVATSLARVRR